MDDECSFQDVARCLLCEAPEPSLHCNICDKHLCTNCERKHLEDKSKKHKVVPFKERMIRLKCQKHSFKQCKLHCEQCNIPLCVKCVSSGEHEQHKTVDVLIYFENKKKKSVLRTTVQDSQISTFPTDQEKKSNFIQQTTENMKRMLKYREQIIPLAIVLGVLAVAVVIVVVVSVVPEKVTRLGNL